MKYIELDNENGKVKKILMDQEKLKFSIKVIVIRGNQKDSKIILYVIGLYVIIVLDYK